MDTKRIKELADVLNASGLTALEICENDIKIRLEKTPAPVTHEYASLPNQTAVPQSAISNTVLSQENNNLKHIKSNMVGVFYSSPSPDAEPFVKVGDTVKKGQVLCIIEAMKLMNEYTATEDGVIAEICVENGGFVEFGQCLFKIN